MKIKNINYILVGLLACVGTYLTLAQTFELKFFLLAPITALAIAFIKGVEPLWKVIIFSLFGTVYSLVFLSGSYRYVAIAALVVIIVLSLLAQRSFEKGKGAKNIVFLSAFVILSLLVGLFVFGSPVKALTVKGQLGEYIEKTYKKDEFIFKDFTFNGKVYGFLVDPKNDRSVSGLKIYLNTQGEIVDEYMYHLKRSLMRPVSESITTVLRENHKNDGFIVYGKDIYGLEDELTVGDEEDRSSDMAFYVHVTNEMLFEDFATLSRTYFEEIMRGGVCFSSITFIGGEKGKKTFEITAPYGFVCDEFENLVEKHDYIEFSKKHIDFKQ